MTHRDSIIDSRLRLGENIRQLRREQQLSQAKLGLMIGRDRSFISRIERGRSNASFETLLLIANGLGISPSEMLLGIGEPQKVETIGIPITMRTSKHSH